MHSQNELDVKAMGGTELVGAGLERNIDPELLNKFQIIRSRVREIDPNKKTILWLHDLPEDPESQHLSDASSRARFDKIVFVSHWQQQQYHDKLGVPYSEGIVIQNGIDPFPVDVLEQKPDPKKDLRLIYHSTPHRGLELLYFAFEEYILNHPDVPVTLDVFSSFKLYGWEERDAPYLKLFGLLKKHPKINYHGTQSNDVVRAALAKSHMFTYPSIWKETSCICAIEAISAGCSMLHPDYAALPETTGGLQLHYPWNENNNTHLQMFYNQLVDSIDLLRNEETPLRELHQLNKLRTDAIHAWSSVGYEWTFLLRNLDN